MTAISTTALLDLALELSSSVNKQDRFERLLDTVRKTIHCDAVALLSFHGDMLKPIALQGLSRDTLGRRFIIAEHPRFEILCHSKGPVRFSADSPLADPYDGLLHDRDGDLPMHACMGLPLLFDDKLLGLLTLDSLTPNVFDDIPSRTLALISAIAASTLNTALLLKQLETQANHSQEVVAQLTEQAWKHDGGEIVGDSPVMQKLKQDINIVARSEFTILIHGETGVGKELVAQTLHQQSLRHHGPLIYVNCAALPEHLIESELFGHVKGAFTGAVNHRAGKFSIADGGTLFLDEIGELPLSAQSKILRAIQSNEIQVVGQDKVEKVNVRILAATNRDLREEVDKGRFRADLFHRLSVFPITVPPLRQRHGDIPLLAGFFIERLRRKLAINTLSFASEAIAIFEQYDWPGNVRELEHLVSRAALKAKARQRQKTMVTIDAIDCGQLLSSEKMPTTATELSFSSQPLPESTSSSPSTMNLRAATDEFQRQLIIKVLSQQQGNWASSARQLETDRANLNRLAKRLDIRVVKSVQ
ncbi:nitric oxide reductase transcriptional regulator NorR [Shewanella sp.]|uniref:nitric oxide reductase transcriptional regulator NorR n=2 Tax=Shewanella sp. TaxID=50422 RepID=UPI0040537F8A